MAQRTYLEPLRYEIGKEISAERYEEALTKIADWFAESRRTREPAALARQLFQECFEGVTREGDKWFSAATASLEKRVRMKCRFDLDTMLPLRTGSERTKERKQKERDRLARKRQDATKDGLIPDELRDDLKAGVKYGDDPHVLLSSAEELRWNTLKESYTRQFPELSTVNAEAELHLLCDLHVLTERHRLKVLKGEKVDPFEAKVVGEQLQSLKKGLGIHPDQLAKRVKDKTDSSISAAAARLESLGNYRLLRERFWVEELIQLWQMYMTPTADGLAYQLDEVGLFGLTRSKPAPCPKCGHRVFAGLSIDEIEQYLVRKGALKRVEPEGGAPAEPPSSQSRGPKGDEGRGVVPMSGDVAGQVEPARPSEVV